VAFPAVLARGTRNNNTGGTATKTTTFPATVAAGDLVIYVFRAPTSTVTLTNNTGGFSVVYNDGGISVISKICDGTESGASFDITFSANTKYTALLYRISGAGPVTASTAGTSAYNPPSLTPPFGAVDYLWLAIASTARTDNVASAAPANYSNLLQQTTTGTDTATGTGDARVVGAERELNAASEDPGAFTYSGTTAASLTLTIAIAPPTAPIWTAYDPVPSVTEAAFKIVTDSAGGTIHGVVTTSATPPSTAQIAAGQDHTGSAAVSSVSVPCWATTMPVVLDGLTGGQTYHFHGYQAASADSAVYSVEFETFATKNWTLNKLGQAKAESSTFFMYYPWLVDTSGVADWPWTVTCFGSTDHATPITAGRVYMCGAVGDPTVPANWETYTEGRVRGAFNTWATANSYTLPTTDYVWTDPDEDDSETVCVHKVGSQWLMTYHTKAFGGGNDNQPTRLAVSSLTGPLGWTRYSGVANGSVLDGASAPLNEQPVGPDGGQHRGYFRWNDNVYGVINEATGLPWEYVGVGTQGGGSVTPTAAYGSDDGISWTVLDYWSSSLSPLERAPLESGEIYVASISGVGVDDLRQHITAGGGQYWNHFMTIYGLSEQLVAKSPTGRIRRVSKTRPIAFLGQPGDADGGQLGLASFLNYNGTYLYAYRGHSTEQWDLGQQKMVGSLMLATLTLDSAQAKPTPISVPNHDKYEWDAVNNQSPPAWMSFVGASSDFSYDANGARPFYAAYGARLSTPFNPATTSFAQITVQEYKDNTDTKQVGLGFHTVGDHSDGGTDYVRGYVKATAGAPFLQYKQGSTSRIDQDTGSAWNNVSGRRYRHGVHWDIANSKLYWVEGGLATTSRLANASLDVSSYPGITENLYPYIGTKGISSAVWRIQKLEVRIGTTGAGVRPVISSAVSSASAVTFTFDQDCIGDGTGITVYDNASPVTGTWSRPTLSEAQFTRSSGTFAGPITYDISSTDIRNEADLVALADVAGVEISYSPGEVTEIPTIQGRQQAQFRADIGTALHYNADFIALMKSDLGVTDGSYNSLLIQWLQFKLSSAETRLSALMDLAAADRGVSRWQEITDPTAIGT
jgi:hypothetical protein